MKPAKLMLALGLGFGLAACSAVDVTTRNTPLEALPEMGQTMGQTLGQSSVQPSAQVQTAHINGVTVDSVRVRVPRSLEVSEANRYLPRGDIVWREDPAGDRYQQVAEIMQNALEAGVAPLDGPVHVNLEVQVNRFHALTQKARYTTGGIHSISFDMVLTDPKTGAMLTEVRTVEADFKAYGGQEALEAEANGLTQKVRISNELAKVIQTELTNPEGYKNARLGLIQMMNHF